MVTVSNLRDGGYSADELLAYDHDNDTSNRDIGYSITEIRKGGYRADELIEFNDISNNKLFTATLLREGGYTATELKIAGYTGLDLSSIPDENKYPITELMVAGYTPDEIRQGGYSRTLLTGGFITQI